MYTKNRIIGVQGGQVQVSQAPASSPAVSASRKMQGTQVNAAGMAIGGAGVPVNAVGAWASEYQYMMTGLIPADPMINDSSNLALFYRDIYLLDATAGSAVDIQSSFPFSDFELRGMDEHELKPFREAVERLNIRRMMPEISVSYLVDGFFCGSLVFDPREKQFIDTLIHDALQCSVHHTQFYNLDPEITVRVGMTMQNFLRGNNVYNRRYLQTLPKSFVDLLMRGQFTLDPVATLYVPRKSLTDRAYVSYLHRILPMYLIEKTMYRGTLTEAHRRQRAMTHITAGDTDWTPTAEELNMIVAQFQQAEYDPLGGWISTRNSVQATDIRPGGDFWKWTDMVDVMTPYKLRALGISESFLSGDASYAAAESAYSSFLETQESYRGFLTDKVFYNKIFPLIAVVNGMYRDPRGRKSSESVIDFLTNTSSRANLKIPEVHWKKQLEADHEDSMFEMLEKLDERGFPIPIKAWTAAAGLDFNSLIADLDEDTAIRKKLEQYTGKDTSHDQDDALPEDYDSEVGASNFTSLSVANGGRRRTPLLNRQIAGDGLVYESNRSGSGRKHIINQVGARAKSNDQIIKASRALQDPHLREQARRRNIEQRGTDVIAGAGEIPSRDAMERRKASKPVQASGDEQYVRRFKRTKFF
jgi:hypothetical protein